MSLQFITAKGEKRFLAGGKIRGGFFRIDGDDGPLYLVEGYATGATIHAAAKGTVLVCFACSNLMPVAETARQAFPGRPMVICADNDHETAARHGKNPGIDRAVAAAQAVQARVAAPDFKEPAGRTDFNDLAASEGLDAVKACLDRAEPPASPPAMCGQTTGAKAPIVVLSATDFLAYGFPKREHILDPILPSQGLALLYAPRGLGKTFLALTLASGVAAGQAVLRWKTPHPRNVLFVDGEMPGWMLQERLSGIVKGYGGPVPEQLRIITPDCQPDFLANLATPEGQAALDPALAGVELLILDNLATLCRIGKENEAESWLPVQAWLLSLRRRGIAVVVVHHANKNGGQRGTSSREDVMDTVIALLPVKNHTPADGARFEVHLQKARGLAGPGADPFVARLVAKDGTFQWTTHSLSENVDKILSLADQGKTVREIAKLTDIPKSTVQRTLDKHLPTKSSASPCPPAGRRVPASQS
ncbi:MAG TPA: AAA family ATPase [Solidesulfovibrio magneticus]|nr:AAA family ATPase [Solidesulfovibrio magneticus]